ncbi:MAG: hypothetical protein ACE5HE_05725 [Phycisphaerae bacterium]
MGKEEEAKFAKRERELGTLRVSVRRERGAATTGSERDPVRYPTLRSLRQAVLMREILGPPVALRSPDDWL